MQNSLLDKTRNPQAFMGASGPNVTALMKRGRMALEDRAWAEADAFFDQVLNMDAENGDAYLGRALAGCQIRDLQELASRLDASRVAVQPVCETAGKPDPAAEERLLAQCALEPYLPRERLLPLLRYDFQYQSLTRPWEEADRRAQAWLSGNRSLMRARQFATGKTKDSIESVITAIRESYESRIRDSRARDEVSRKAVLEGYAQLLEGDALVKLCENARVERQKDYSEGLRLLESGDWVEAQELFEKTAQSNYRDSRVRLQACKQKTAQKRKKSIRIFLLVSAACVAVALLAVLTVKVILPGVKYQQAVALMEDGEFDKAQDRFRELGDYKDSRDMIPECDYRQAEAYLAAGDTYAAAITFASIPEYGDAWQRSFALWGDLTHRDALIAGAYHTVALKSDGTAVATGWNAVGECEVSDWKNLVSVSAGNNHTVGLKADGTVVAVGSNLYGQCNVSSWRDIVAISAGAHHTAGPKADGTVVAAGDNKNGQCEVSGWKNIIAVSVGGSHTVGLKADGTVVSVGKNDHGQCEVSEWKDIVAISAREHFTVGLKADGTVVAVGENKDGQCNVSDWENIVAVSAGKCHTLGLKADGTMVVVGDNKYGQCNVSDWRNITAISGGWEHSVGLKLDGTVVAVGKISDGQCDVSDWTGIRLPE